jgi:predicted GIY-YIG superfamily endonuclease
VTATPYPAAPSSSGRHPLGTVYLLHFDQRYEHAGHYTGWAEDLDRRIPEHQQGRGARLVEVITQAGISFRVARLWPGVTRARERQLKRQGGASRRCPICLDQHPTPGHGRKQAATQHAQAVPTRGTTPAQARTFLQLNEAFARPVAASPAKQWSRVRGREQIELLTPRVTAGWFEENQLPSQQRAYALIRRGVQARTQARQHHLADRAEHARTQAVAGRTRQRLASAHEQHHERAGGRAGRVPKDDADER